MYYSDTVFVKDTVICKKHQSVSFVLFIIVILYSTRILHVLCEKHQSVSYLETVGKVSGPSGSTITFWMFSVAK